MPLLIINEMAGAIWVWLLYITTVQCLHLQHRVLKIMEPFSAMTLLSKK